MNAQVTHTPDIVTVTAVADDGAQWGYPGKRVFRYEGGGFWAWIPTSSINESLGDVIDLNAPTLEQSIVSRAAIASATGAQS